MAAGHALGRLLDSNKPALFCNLVLSPALFVVLAGLAPKPLQTSMSRCIHALKGTHAAAVEVRAHSLPPRSGSHMSEGVSAPGLGDAPPSGFVPSPPTTP